MNFLKTQVLNYVPLYSNYETETKSSPVNTTESERKMLEMMYQIIDLLMEASQDSANHSAFDQLRKSLSKNKLFIKPDDFVYYPSLTGTSIHQVKELNGVLYLDINNEAIIITEEGKLKDTDILPVIFIAHDEVICKALSTLYKINFSIVNKGQRI